MDKVDIKLDIDLMNDALYNALLAAFRREVERQGLDPSDYYYDKWEVTGVAIKHEEV